MQEFKNLVDIVTKLRSPKGCPWDKKQKVRDFKNYLLEEVYELIEAIDNKDVAHVKEELGDVILLVVSMAEIYREKNILSIEEVLKEIADKLIRRHPHVFGNLKLGTPEAVLKNWARLKNKEKKRKTFYEKIPRTLPALFYTYLIFKERQKFSKEKKMGAGQDAKAVQKAVARFLRTKRETDLASVLFQLAAIAAAYKINPELALLKKAHAQAKREKYR